MTTDILIARDGQPVAEGELRHVFIESGGGGSTASIPDPIRAGLARYQAPEGP
jgi:acyl-CoA thioesterase FadM